MAFYHREDFCFRILSVREEKHREQHKIEPQEVAKLIIYLHTGALSRIQIDSEESTLSNVNMVLLPKGRAYSRRGEVEQAIVVELDILGKEPTRAECITTPKISSLVPMFSKLALEWQGRRQGYRLRAHRLLYDIFEKLSHYDEPSGRDIQFNIVSNGVRYFQTNFCEFDCSITEAARLSGVSERYFRKLFTDIYGIAPTHYLRELRIKRACELLAEGGMSISDIALSCGFDDAKYFSRVFREIMNTTPTHYARLTSGR